MLDPARVPGKSLLLKVRARLLTAGVFVGLLLGAGLFPASASAQDSVDDLPRMGQRPCVHGFAGPFPCDRVDLMSFLPMDEIGGGPGSIFGGPGNDVWGWTDPQTGKE